jgi:proteasome accessory factor A
MNIITHPRVLAQKILGFDVEVFNQVLGASVRDTGYHACRALLSEIDGVPAQSWLWRSHSSGSSWYRMTVDSYGGGYSAYGGDDYSADAQDSGRRYLYNGDCDYEDMGHFEMASKEVRSAFDFVATWHAGLRRLRGAMHRANAKLPAGKKIQVLVNNSVGKGESWGGHLNVNISRRAFDDLFERRLHHLLYLASYQVASLAVTGQGKVGAENGKPPVAFQIGTRADFMERIRSLSTTSARGIINERDEAHCGRGSAADKYARLHCIFYDSTLCPVATLLKSGLYQLCLTAIEAGAVNPALILDDPAEALLQFSRDPLLEAKATMANGAQYTAPELLSLFLSDWERLAATGALDETTPHWREILSLAMNTVDHLMAGRLEACTGRLDYLLKLSACQQCLEMDPSLTWESPQLKQIDLQFGSLDEEEGLYWAFERDGQVERVVEEDRILYFMEHPAEDTRAWTRALLLRTAGRGEIESVDWDAIRFRLRGGYRTVHLNDPAGHGRAVVEPLVAGAGTLEEMINAIESSSERRAIQETTGGETKGAYVQ